MKKNKQIKEHHFVNSCRKGGCAAYDILADKLKVAEAENKELREYQLIYDDDTALKKVKQQAEEIKRLKNKHYAICQDCGALLCWHNEKIACMKCNSKNIKDICLEVEFVRQAEEITKWEGLYKQENILATKLLRVRSNKEKTIKQQAEKIKALKSSLTNIKNIGQGSDCIFCEKKDYIVEQALICGRGPDI